MIRFTDFNKPVSVYLKHNLMNKWTFKENLFLVVFLIICSLSNLHAQILPGFQKSIYFNEQIRQFDNPQWAPDVEILINAPAAKKMNQAYKTLLILFATPNGNTIEQTIGNTDSIKADWHYDIQHIAAQTRFLREKLKKTNVITCYLQARQKSWGAWRKIHSDTLIAQIADSIRLLFSNYNTSVVLNGHSGGGNFVFGYLNAHQNIPDYIERIAFLDSNYAYDESLDHGKKIAEWLKKTNKNSLCILAYNDSVALYEGKSFVSPTGGTWYRSMRMADYLGTEFQLKCISDSDFIRFSGLKNRICIVLKTNKERAILHTIQVERNGFIHSMLSGTPFDEKSYKYYPLMTPFRVYSPFIQQGCTFAGAQFPERKKNSLKFSEFYKQIDTIPLQYCENKILEQLKQGNFPEFMREFVNIEYTWNKHKIKIQVLPDYLCVGTDADFCRMPMNPQTAQAFADLTGCILPTRLLVDSIHKHAYYRLEPVTFYPVGRNNELVSMFLKHNKLIEKQLDSITKKPNRHLIIDGIKKDVVICNKIADLPKKVAIYGWYKLDGKPIQPVYTGHVNWYVDYSHGIRLINRLAFIDGKPVYIDKILSHPNLYQIFSSEDIPMNSARYNCNPE